MYYRFKETKYIKPFLKELKEIGFILESSIHFTNLSFTPFFITYGRDLEVMGEHLPRVSVYFDVNKQTFDKLVIFAKAHFKFINNIKEKFFVKDLRDGQIERIKKIRGNKVCTFENGKIHHSCVTYLTPATQDEVIQYCLKTLTNGIYNKTQTQSRKVY